MRAVAATILLMGAGVLTGRALGDTVPVPPVPTVPTVTVSTPVVTVPITVPTLPAPPPPTATTPVRVPNPTSPTPVAPSTTAPAPPLPPTSSVVGSATGGTSGAGLPSGGSSSSPWGSSSPRSSSSSGSSSLPAGSFSSGRGSGAPSVARFHSSRTWIATTGPKSRRAVTLTFSLLHAERLFFVVQQVAPSCRTVDHFSVRGHPGKNRIRFPARGSRLRLGPGTYRVAVQTRSGLLAQRVTIVVVDRGRPSRDEIAAARAADVCAATAGGVAAARRTRTASQAASQARSAGTASRRARTPARAPCSARPWRGRPERSSRF